MLVWHIWKPFRPPFGLTTKPKCCEHRQAPNISQGWVVLFCPLAGKPGNGRRTEEPLPTLVSFPRVKMLEKASWSFAFGSEVSPRWGSAHPQFEAPLGILGLHWEQDCCQSSWSHPLSWSAQVRLLWPAGSPWPPEELCGRQGLEGCPGDKPAQTPESSVSLLRSQCSISLARLTWNRRRWVFKA